MKLHHYVLAFVVFLLGTIIVVDMKVSEGIYMSSDADRNSAVFDKAVDAATNELLSSISGVSVLTKEEAVRAFYDSLSASLGIADAPVSRRDLSLYVPVICVTDKDGFYINYNMLSGSAGDTEVKRCWTEKISYTYRETTAPAGYRATGFIIRFLGGTECVVYDTNGVLGPSGTAYRMDVSDLSEYDFSTTLNGGMNYYSIINHPDVYDERRAEVISTTMSNYLNYYCNRHNEVAERAGVIYRFSIPAFDSAVYLRAVENASFLAFFQGYPIPGTDQVFNRYSVSNSQVVSATAYYIDDTGLYHRDGCPLTYTTVDVEFSEHDAAAMGAYACPKCFPDTGAHRH